MKKTLLALLVTFTLPAWAQTKVALASLYIENRIDLNDFGKDASFSYDIVGDYIFDLKPLVNRFRDSLFVHFPNKSYALLPETTVIKDRGYKVFRPRYYDDFSSLECTSPAGYKIIYIEDTDFAAGQLGQLLPITDETMYIAIDFKLIKGIKPGDPVHMLAHATIKKYNKTGKQALNTSISATDNTDTKANDPSEIEPKEAFILCQSAMEELTRVMKATFKKQVPRKSKH